MSNKVKVLILLPILTLFLTGCTLSDLPVIGRFFGGGSSGPVTLNVWGLWENPDVMKAMIAKYQETNPEVTINYDDRSIMNPVDYKERVFSRAQSSDAEVDIMLAHNSWIPRLSTTLSSMPADLMSADEYSQKFYPIIGTSGVVNGQVYATPAYYDGLVLVYNKKHFEEIGQRVPPTAWEEFRLLALELTTRGGSSGTQLVRGGAAIGTAGNISHFSDILGTMWAQAGVKIPSGLDTKPAYDALTYYTNFAKEDKVWDETMPEASSAFAAGKVSMIFVPGWQLLDIMEVMPNINDIGVAPVPQAIESNPASWGTFWMYVVPQNSENKEAAWKFLDFLVQDEQQLMYYNEAAKTRAFGPLFSSMNLALELSNAMLTPILDTAPYARSGEIAARSGNRRQVDALAEAVKTVLSGGSSEQALKKAKEEIDQ